MEVMLTENKRAKDLMKGKDGDIPWKVVKLFRHKLHNMEFMD